MSESSGTTENSPTRELPQRRRLERRADDKIVGGVCSGLGTYFEIDPLWFRIGFVVMSLPGAFGVILYLAGWALMPRPGEPSPLQRKRSPSTWIGAILLGIAALMMLPVLEALVQFGTSPFGPSGFNSPGIDYFPGPAFLALGLIAIGVVLLRQRDEGRGPLAPSAPPRRPDNTSTEQVVVADREVTTPMTYAPTYQPPRVRRDRSALSAFIIAAVLLIVGTAAVVSSAELMQIDVGQLTALALFIIGAGLIVGAWWGRARLMILLGLLLIPVVLVTSVVDFPLTGTIGGGYVAPRLSGELHDLDYTAGSVTLDLSEYRFDEGVTDVDIRMGVGNVQIVVPSRVHAIVSVDVRSGDASVFRAYDSGADLSLTEEGGEADAVHRLRLHIAGGLTSVNVYRTRWGYLQRVERREKRLDAKEGASADRGARSGDRSKKGDKR